MLAGWPPASDVGHLQAGLPRDHVRHDRAVAGGVVALEAEQAAAAAGRQGGEVRELVPGGIGFHVLAEDAVQLGHVAGACRDPARLRGTEGAQVKVADAVRREGGGQQGLGEAGLAGLRDRADVDEQLDPVGQQAGQGGVERLGLVAGGEEPGLAAGRVGSAQTCLPMRPTM